MWFPPLFLVSNWIFGTAAARFSPWPQQIRPRAGVPEAIRATLTVDSLKESYRTMSV